MKLGHEIRLCRSHLKFHQLLSIRRCAQCLLRNPLKLITEPERERESYYLSEI